MTTTTEQWQQQLRAAQEYRALVRAENARVASQEEEREKNRTPAELVVGWRESAATYDLHAARCKWGSNTRREAEYQRDRAERIACAIEAGRDIGEVYAEEGVALP
jgi:hypothetical protein